MAQELTQERLKELLHYDPETGVFTWKIAAGRAGIGGTAGTPNELGYIRIMIDGRVYRAHRLAHFYTYGEMPNGMLDHRDQDKSNNRIDNLRVATRNQNGLNRGPQANNTSGHKGVSWHKRMKMWTANIRIAQKLLYLGAFDSLMDAVAARKAAEKALGVSEFCPQ